MNEPSAVHPPAYRWSTSPEIVYRLDIDGRPERGSNARRRSACSSSAGASGFDPDPRSATQDSTNPDM